MPPATVISIGIFDGVHLGHRAIIGRAREIAAARGLPTLAITFDPFPARILRPDQELRRLTDIDQRARLIHDAGADRVLVIQTTREFLNLTAESFLRLLVDEHNPAAVVEGPNFHFGKGRKGDASMLVTLAPAFGFDAEVVAQQKVALSDLTLAPVSSSLVRWLIAQGRTVDAAIALCRAYDLASVVVVGEKRGRRIGVPTVNLDPIALADRVIPGDGVYAGEAELPDGSVLPAAISIGVKPTMRHPGAGAGVGARVIEAHLLGFAGDLYGQRIVLRFGRWVRDQQPFPGIAALQAQLRRDIEAIRQLAQRGILTALAPAPGMAHRLCGAPGAGGSQAEARRTP